MAALRLSLESAIAWAAKQQELAPWVEGALAALAAAGPEPEIETAQEPRAFLANLHGQACASRNGFSIQVEVLRLAEFEAGKRRAFSLVHVRLPGGEEDQFQARDLTFEDYSTFDVNVAAVTLSDRNRSIGGAR